MPAKKPTDTHDTQRGNAARMARGALPAAIYVTKRGEEEKTIGREKTIQATIDAREGISIRGEIVEVAGVVYDGNAAELARPVRFALTAEGAKELIEDLDRFVRFIDVGAE